jgi:pimeloyl-ACP methyl ester carboxylesterase
MFVTIGIIDMRANGFLLEGLTIIGIIELLVTLQFYSEPSEADRVLGYITAALLAVDTIAILSIPILRHRNGGLVGILTIFGALVTVVLATIADRVVEWGKIQEEIRLTGRSETRRTLTEWIKVMFSVIGKSLVLVLVGFMSVSILIDSYDVIRVQVDGELVPVDNGGYSVHVYCTEAGIDGTRPPGLPSRSNVTVIVEGGETSSEEFASWILEMHELNEVGRVCYWDRPGFGLSDNSPSPMSAGSVADAFSEALIAEVPDFENESLVLVSHGIGGIYSRVFAGRHTTQLKALLLVDTLHEDLLYEQSSAWSGFLYWLRGMISPLGIQKLVGWIFNHEGPKSRIFGDAQVYSGQWSKAKLQEQISARGLTKGDITASNALLPSKLPVAVASSAKSIRRNRRWSEKQRALTKLTSNNIEWRIIDGPHELWRSPSGRAELKDLLKVIFDYVI